MKAVTVSNLSKSYDSSKYVVSDISFTLNKGYIFGFLGPNGAGKSTTVKLLSGLLQPTKGECRIFDIDPFGYPEKVHEIMGVVTEHAQMYDSLTGFENLMFYGELFGLNKNESKLRADSLLKNFGLEEAKDKKLSAYSTGMRQRLSLGRAMVQKPDILFLDEPTSGLDPESVQSVNNMIKSLSEEDGITVFLCTHQLRYAQEICTSYGLINDGTLLACGDMDYLKSLISPDIKISIETDYLPDGIHPIKKNNDKYEIRVKSREDIPSIVKTIAAHDGNIFHLSEDQVSLEEIYFSLLEKAKRRGIK